MAPRVDGVSAHRGAILHFLADPAIAGASYEYFPAGMLVIESGRVQRVGPADEVTRALSADVPTFDHGDDLLIPGFIDTHIHYPQTDVIASGGRQLLDWLDDYTFPAERQFGDAQHAAEVAEFFLDELLRNGTTTALVFCTVHAASVNAFFTSADRRGLRMIAGKVLMDRNCPEELRERGLGDSAALLERWHGRDRLAYAITPRFAPTSSDAQLRAAGALAKRYPDAYVHSHLAENRAEIAWVRELFPQANGYLDVYARHGLLRDRAVYAHCLHLDDNERRWMARAGAAAAFCPTSNLYLGSGLFDLEAADRTGLKFGMATDVGGGTRFGLLPTLGEAYKVAHLSGQHLDPLRAFYLATLGGARVLAIADKVGSFATGREADFVALNLRATPLLARRTEQSRTLKETLLVLMTLADDRAVRETYVLGRRVHAAP